MKGGAVTTPRRWAGGFWRCGRDGFLLLLGMVSVWAAHAQGASDPLALKVLTNVGSFREVSGQDFLRGCPFHLTGIVTLVDTNRGLVVLQDATGAAAIDVREKASSLEPGQMVSLESDNGSPYVASFPDYPYRPSGADWRTSFEAPLNWGDYHLTRMRAVLHPPVTGKYTFWIAADNSGELWLSSDENPGNVKRIAFLRSGEWVNSREWTRYPSQCSEPIVLEGGRAYYLEAFQEQLTLDDNLAVAWEGPWWQREVIAENYLTPCVPRSSAGLPGQSGNVLREYWTNYFIGSLTTITGPRPFEFALAARQVKVTPLGSRAWPEPRRISLDQQLRLEDNYLWVEMEGAVNFIGGEGASGILELADAQARVLVRAPNWKGHSPRTGTNWTAKVQGVCEGVLNEHGQLVPGCVWVPTPEGVSLFESATNSRPDQSLTGYHFAETASGFTNRYWRGFLTIRGVVTLNDRVLGKDCLFIQDATAGMSIVRLGSHLGENLQPGQWVEFGGDLQPGKYPPALRPLFVKTLGWRAMPEPVGDPVEPPVAPSRDGQWTQLEGVVRSINPNGTLSLMTKGGAISVWIGQEPSPSLARHVDSYFRCRGVLALSLQADPLLLVPTPGFIEETLGAADPFALPLTPITTATAREGNPVPAHRVHVRGMIVWRNDRLLFVQDTSGGKRLKVTADSPGRVGDWIEAAGFPDGGETSASLSDGLTRLADPAPPITPHSVNLGDTAAEKHDGSLLQLKALLLAQRANETSQLLEVQQGQHIFEVALALSQGRLPAFESGSLLKITGVCDVKPAAHAAAKANEESGAPASVKILLRGPSDVVLLRGPPVWTSKRASALISGLLVVLAGVVLRIYLSRRRLERQQAAQFAFSRQILQSQENERRRIAANLHDSLGQSLLVIKNQARMAMQPAGAEAALQQRLNEISTVASQAIEDVRQITHDLRPYQLDRLGLTQALRAVIKQVSENSSILFASHVEEIDGLFNQESEIHLYRIVQESLNNIIKHSGAAEATVVIKQQSGALSLSFRDNGRGFASEKVLLHYAPRGGFGLSGIAERARILGGKLTIDSQPGRGTNLTVVIPAAASKHET